jgi:hypothetical protein
MQMICLGSVVKSDNREGKVVFFKDSKVLVEFINTREWFAPEELKVIRW